MIEKILCVDDDPNILEGLRRTLRKEFNLVTAQSGEEGLEVMASDGPFAVVVSDQRMPGMGGIRFLAKVCEVAPETVRIMLTGFSDQPTAIDAVNEGNIFRFLTKPCPADLLMRTLKSAIEQYRLVTSERILLEDTLKGSIKVLVDILALAAPVVFSRTLRIREHVTQIAAALELPNIWQFEVAAMLSQIGSVTIPSTIIEKSSMRDQLSMAEVEMLATIPDVGAALIANIPRMESVAEMIKHQHQPVSYWHQHSPEANGSAMLGAQILKVAIDFEALLAHGASRAMAIEALAANTEVYPYIVVAALGSEWTETAEADLRTMPVTELRAGMFLADDIRSTAGDLIVCRGSEVTDTLRQRLLNYASLDIVPDTVTVFPSPLEIPPLTG